MAGISFWRVGFGGVSVRGLVPFSLSTQVRSLRRYVSLPVAKWCCPVGAPLGGASPNRRHQTPVHSRTASPSPFPDLNSTHQGSQEAVDHSLVWPDSPGQPSFLCPSSALAPGLASRWATVESLGEL